MLIEKDIGIIEGQRYERGKPDQKRNNERERERERWRAIKEIQIEIACDADIWFVWAEKQLTMCE